MGIQSVGAPHGPGPLFPSLSDGSRQNQAEFADGIESKGVKFWSDACSAIPMGPFVFGASVPKQGDAAGSGSAAHISPELRFGAIAGASSLSSTGGGCVSRSVSVSELLDFRAAKSGKLPQERAGTPVDSEAVTSKFSAFNIGSSATPSSRADGSSGQDRVLPVAGDAKSATMSFASFAVGLHPVGTSDNSTTPSLSSSWQFVFSAGSASGAKPSNPSSLIDAGQDKSSMLPVSNSQEIKDEKGLSGPAFVFTGTSRSGVLPTCTDEQASTPPPVVSSNPNPSFTFCANGETKGGAKIKKEKIQHRPLRPGQRPVLKGKKGPPNTREELETAAPSPSRAGVSLDFSMQDSTQPAPRSQSGVPDLCKPQVPPLRTVEDEEVEGPGRRGTEASVNISLSKLRAVAVELNLGAKPELAVGSSSSSFKFKDHSLLWATKSDSGETASTAGFESNWKNSSLGDAQVAVDGPENAWMDEGNMETLKVPEGVGCTTTSTIPRVEVECSNAWSPFTFTASPSGVSSSTLRRRARRVQKERATGRVGLVSKVAGAVPGIPASVGDASKTGPFSGIRSNSWLSAPSNSSLGCGEDVSSPGAVGAAAAEQCEQWRLRGNQAYSSGDFRKAEEFYSLGARSVSSHENSQSCVRASMLCYSNRAATRMVVGRMREALADCMHAMAVDPNFFRVQLRAANCHLALGETEAAAAAFKECLRGVKDSKQPNSKILAEASEGLRKAQQVEDYTGLVRKLLGNTICDANTALRLLNDALLSSPQSEWLLELKACVLISVQRYNEAVQLCEQSLPLAERNYAVEERGNSNGEASKLLGPLGWRWRLTSKAKFHLGKLEDSLEILQRLQDGPPAIPANEAGGPGGMAAEIVVPSMAIIRDLLRHKAEGNKAFQAGKHAEALEHYTAALARNGESRPFCAVCLCNRAAASQALGHVADAIADCSRAIALDPRYAKAISRRAALHEKVRDYGQACHDLRRLITIQVQQGRGHHGVLLSSGQLGSSVEDLQRAHDRLDKAEEELNKGQSLDHYIMLGVEVGSSANEIKKAYRKAALRHHPDKAGQFLVRTSENGDDPGLWKDVGDEVQLRRDGERLIDEVRRDAERLFKLIGEAYAVLSDPSKRLRYDANEELRKLRTRTNDLARSVFFGANERKHSRTNDGGQSKWGSSGVGEPGNQSRARRQRDHWDGFNYQYQRWQTGPDAAQPDIYARRGRPTGSNYSTSNRATPWRWEDYSWDDT